VPGPGELGGLRRCDIDLAACTVRVIRQLAEVRGGGFAFGPPKSAAGTRVVTIPEVIIPVVQWHLTCFAKQDDDEGLAFHDLRHTGNTLAGLAGGATLRELMDRMGHDSQRAAMVYLHGSDERQQQIADTLSKLTREELKRGSNRPNGQATGKRSGTQRARNRERAS
jgi:integrase